MTRSCETCINIKGTQNKCGECSWITMSGWKPSVTTRTQQNYITFHRLNGLTPTFSSCRDKVYEEIGEVMQLLGKGQRASGERAYPAALGPEQDNHADWVYRIFGEILDSAQALVTMAFVLADENNIDVPGEIGRHEAKLLAKGYLVESEAQI